MLRKSGLLFGVLLLVLTSAALGEGKTADTRQTRVVFSYPKAAGSVNRSEFPVIVLAHAEAEAEIRLRRKKGMQVLEVEPGRYYVRQIVADQFSFANAPMPRPKSDDRFIEVPANAVVYLGDVDWSSHVGLRMQFSRAGLLALQKMRALHDAPLRLTAFGMEPRVVSWD